jgi:aminoglycoside phosphotransferase (APT) family kinase protein
MQPSPTSSLSETAPVRAGEEIDAQRLAVYLRDQLGDIGETLAIEQFPGGHSNLTYLIRTGGAEYVLRRPPLGPVPPKAHDMAREYRILSRIHPAFPAAPKVYLLCEDPAIIGAPFFLMERRHGTVLRGRGPSAVNLDADTARRVSRGFMDCFVALHAVDVVSSELLSLGKPEGFLERQVQGWTERWRRAKTDDVPDMDDVIRWLAGRMPPSPSPTLVHNDFKLDNLILATNDLGRVEAVLDWEMTTIGDPFADVGLSLCYWTSGIAGGPDLAVPGWYTRDEFVNEYAKRTGRDVANVRWHEVLGIFKLAVILQQIYFRWKAGQTRDERFAVLGAQVRDLADRARTTIDSRY